MSDPISAKALFTAGLTREQFIQKYLEIQQSSEEKNSSIFTEDFTNSVGQIFDTLNAHGKDNNVLEESEISLLQGFDGDNTNLSESDLKALYIHMGNEILSKHSKKLSPEEAYNNAMANTDAQSSTYVQDLRGQISILEELISHRKINSTNIQQMYQSQIDDIIKKDTNLSTEQKTEYIKLSEDLSSLQKEADKNAAEMKKIEAQLRENEDEIKFTQSEIDSMNSNNEEDSQGLAVWTNDLNRLLSEKADLNYQYKTLSAKQKSLNTQITKTKSSLDEKSIEINAANPDLKAKIATYKNMIAQEKVSSESEIKSYESQISTLRASQSYAIEQIQKAPTSSNNSAGASHQNDNLMSFDELKAMGLEYSSGKGQKLAGTIQKHLKGFTGYCSKHVSNALSESGLGNERCGSAADMDSKLGNNNNFKEIKVSSADDLKKLPAGCVLVYERGAARYSSKHGHIEVTLGDGTAGSDGRTRNLRYTENMHVFVPVEQSA